jgi:hypothetical protein
MTSVYCSNDFGICRPQPMFFYLKDDWQETKFQRDLVSVTFNLTFIVVNFLLQIAIEIKKRKMQNVVAKAEEMATAAKQNVENAKLKLTLQNNVECEGQKDVAYPHQTLEIVGTEVHEDEISKVTSSSNALKVARAVSLFAILPASIFTILFSLENMGDWRPHGAAASSMISFGIVVPCVLFIYNIKLRKFAFNYLKNKIQKLKCTSRRIYPIV